MPAAAAAAGCTLAAADRCRAARCSSFCGGGWAAGRLSCPRRRAGPSAGGFAARCDGEAPRRAARPALLLADAVLAGEAYAEGVEGLRGAPVREETLRAATSALAALFAQPQPPAGRSPPRRSRGAAGGLAGAQGGAGGSDRGAVAEGEAALALAQAKARQALLHGITYPAGAHHARRCTCGACGARRAALEKAWPLVAAACAEAESTQGFAAEEAALQAQGFKYAGGTSHAEGCPCPHCCRRREGQALPVPPAVPRPPAVTTQLLSVQVCADGGFVVGSASPWRHLPLCKCPNCNKLRAALRSGHARVDLDADQSALLPLSPSYQATPEEMAAKEVTRRARISARNAGRLPWNTGKVHSETTKAKIARTTRVALQSPDTRARISAAAVRQHSTGSRAAIAAGMQAYLLRRRTTALAAISAALAVDGVALASRSLPGVTWLGLGPRRALVDTVTPPAPPPRPPGRPFGSIRKPPVPPRPFDPNRSSGTYKSPQHRARIAESVRARWQDPEYAERVRASMRTSVLERSQRPSSRPMSYTRSPSYRRPSSRVVAEDDDEEMLLPPRRVLTAEQEAQRSALAAQAQAMLAQAQAAAAALQAQGGEIDPAVLADVTAAVDGARKMLARFAVQTLPPPMPPVRAARARREAGGVVQEMVWYQGRLVSATERPAD